MGGQGKIIYEGPINEQIEGCGDLTGWLKRTYQRTDKYYYTPEHRVCLRSKSELQRYFQYFNDANAECYRNERQAAAMAKAAGRKETKEQEDQEAATTTAATTTRNTTPNADAGEAQQHDENAACAGKRKSTIPASGAKNRGGLKKGTKIDNSKTQEDWYFVCQKFEVERERDATIKMAAFLRSPASGENFTGSTGECTSFGKYLKKYKAGDLKPSKLTRTRKRKYKDIEMKLIEFLNQQDRRDECGVSWSILKEKCSKWAKEAGHNTFSASSCWLNSVMQRYESKKKNKITVNVPTTAATASDTTENMTNLPTTAAAVSAFIDTTTTAATMIADAPGNVAETNTATANMAAAATASAAAHAEILLMFRNQYKS